MDIPCRVCTQGQLERTKRYRHSWAVQFAGAILLLGALGTLVGAFRVVAPDFSQPDWVMAYDRDWMEIVVIIALVTFGGIALVIALACFDSEKKLQCTKCRASIDAG